MNLGPASGMEPVPLAHRTARAWALVAAGLPPLAAPLHLKNAIIAADNSTVTALFLLPVAILIVRWAIAVALQGLTELALPTSINTPALPAYSAEKAQPRSTIRWA